MAADISVGIGVLGEKEFKRALDECQNSLKQLDSGLKANAAEFGKSDDALRQSAERVELLKRGYDESAKQVKALGEAVEWSKGQYGELSNQTTKYVIAQNKARENAARFAKELENADRNMTEMGRDAGRVGRQLEQGIGEAAEDTARKFDSMVNKLDQDIGDIKSAVSLSAFADIGGAITGGVVNVYQGISGLVDETMEYRRSMSLLKQNAADAGIEFEDIEKMMLRVTSITGDMDAAVEGVSNLLGAGLNAEEMTRVIEQISGAIISFPDTYKFETLAEDLRMAIGEGQITGSLSELLTTLMGAKDLEKINKALEKSAKVGENAVKTSALAALTESGLEKTAQSWRESNAEMVAYFEAQAMLTKSQADLATVMTPAATAGIEMMAGMIDKITNLITVSEEKLGKYREEIEKARSEEEAFTEQVDAETGYYSQIEDLNEEIKKADIAGDIQGAAKLIEERAKVQQDLIDYLQETEPTDEVVQQKADEMVQKTTSGVGALFESFGRSLIGDYWYEHIFGDEEDLMSKIDTTGKDMVSGLSDSIDTNAYLAVNSVRNMMASMQAELNRGLKGPTISGGTATTTSSTRYAGTGGSATITLDGKNVGEGMVDYNSDAMGAKLARVETYG